MGDDNYLSKIERNTYALDHAPEEVREECRQNILWSREMTRRLPQLDYAVREATIAKIHAVLDADYTKMGFQLEEQQSNSMSHR